MGVVVRTAANCEEKSPGIQLHGLTQQKERQIDMGKSMLDPFIDILEIRDSRVMWKLKLKQI